MDVTSSRTSTTTARAGIARRPAAALLTGVALAAFGATSLRGADGSGSTTTNPIPTTLTVPQTPGSQLPGATQPVSPIAKNPAASRPTGLDPDNPTDPIVYPGTPVVLSWSKVKGAAKYDVQVSPVASFAQVSWSGQTDQTSVAPTSLLPDGVYYWRVIAKDSSDNASLPSSAARFRKTWDSRVSGLKAAESVGGPTTALFALQPYFAWGSVPGATAYDVEISPADRFAQVAFLKDFTVSNGPSLAVKESALLPDDSYQWRVRAKDATGNVGDWSLPQAFTKAWGTVTPIAPANDAITDRFIMQWSEVPGAVRYQIQVSIQAHTFEGSPLVVNKTTSNTAWTPSWADWEQMRGAATVAYGHYFWRVRAIIGDIKGAWSPERHVEWIAPAASVPTINLQPVPDVETALAPIMQAQAVTTANMYRFDVATDRYFNNIVRQEWTPQAAWIPVESLPDNQVGIGYYWRVVWGLGTSLDNPAWQVDEGTVPVSQFRKQAKIVANPVTGTVTDPPGVSWQPVSGAGKYEVQASPTPNFSQNETITTPVFGTSVVPNAQDAGKRLKDGAWFWRVRPVDGSGQTLTWSPVQQFTLQGAAPKLAEPADAFESAGAPRLRWAPVVPSCGYEVALSNTEGFTEIQTTVIKTAQVGYVPTGVELKTLGKWYWRVRSDQCSGSTSPWSETRSFVYTGDPDFGLKKLKSRVAIGEQLRISGRLKFSGKPVSRPELVLERRFPNQSFKEIAKVKGDGFGQFTFRLNPTRSAGYRILWKRPNGDGGETTFALGVTPRLTLKLKTAKVLRGGKVSFSGTVSPVRRVRVEVKTRTGWQTIATIDPSGKAFKATVKANVEPGRLKLRATTAADATLASALSPLKNLFVYDRFVLVTGTTP